MGTPDEREEQLEARRRECQELIPKLHSRYGIGPESEKRTRVAHMHGFNTAVARFIWMELKRRKLSQHAIAELFGLDRSGITKMVQAPRIDGTKLAYIVVKYDITLPRAAIRDEALRAAIRWMRKHEMEGVSYEGDLSDETYHQLYVGQSVEDEVWVHAFYLTIWMEEGI